MYKTGLLVLLLAIFLCFFSPVMVIAADLKNEQYISEKPVLEEKTDPLFSKNPNDYKKVGKQLMDNAPDSVKKGTNIQKAQYLFPQFLKILGNSGNPLNDDQKDRVYYGVTENDRSIYSCTWHSEAIEALFNGGGVNDVRTVVMRSKFENVPGIDLVDPNNNHIFVGVGDKSTGDIKFFDSWMKAHLNDGSYIEPDKQFDEGVDLDSYQKLADDQGYTRFGGETDIPDWNAGSLGKSVDRIDKIPDIYTITNRKPVDKADSSNSNDEKDIEEDGWSDNEDWIGEDEWVDEGDWIDEGDFIGEDEWVDEGDWTDDKKSSDKNDWVDTNNNNYDDYQVEENTGDDSDWVDFDDIFGDDYQEDDSDWIDYDDIYGNDYQKNNGNHLVDNGKETSKEITGPSLVNVNSYPNAMIIGYKANGHPIYVGPKGERTDQCPSGTICAPSIEPSSNGEGVVFSQPIDWTYVKFSFPKTSSTTKNDISSNISPDTTGSDNTEIERVLTY